MTMPLYTSVPSDTLTASIAQLKRTARTHVDVCAWFRDNLPALGIEQPEDIECIEITFEYSLESALDMDADAIPTSKATVHVVVTDATERHPGIDNGFNLDGRARSSHRCDFDMYLPFNEWPFLSCALAALILDDLLPNMRVRGNAVLDTYLGQHFPGMTWTHLKTLHAADLLPTKDSGYINFDAFVDVLYATRSANQVVDLPNMDLLSSAKL